MRALGSILTLFLFIAGFVSLASPSLAWAKSASSRQNSVFTYVAASSALGLGALRVGYGKWEVGLLNQQTLGVDKQVFSSDSAYASFGFGLALAVRTGPSIFASIGWEPRLFWKLYCRAEMNASAATTGQSIAQVLLGLSLRL